MVWGSHLLQESFPENIFLRIKSDAVENYIPFNRNDGVKKRKYIFQNIMGQG